MAHWKLIRFASLDGGGQVIGLHRTGPPTTIASDDHHWRGRYTQLDIRRMMISINV